MTIISLIDSLYKKYRLAHASQPFSSPALSFWQQNEEIETEQNLIDRFNIWWNNVIINETDSLNTKQLIALFQLMDEVMVQLRQKIRNNIALKKSTQFTNLEVFICEVWIKLFVLIENKKNGNQILSFNPEILQNYDNLKRKSIEKDLSTLFDVSCHLRLLHRKNNYSTLKYEINDTDGFILPEDIRIFYKGLKHLINPDWLYTLKDDNSAEDYLNHGRLQQLLFVNKDASAIYRLLTNRNIAALMQAKKLDLADFKQYDEQSLADHDNLKPDLTDFSENRKTFPEFLSEFISIEHIKHDLFFTHEAYEIIAEKQAENFRNLQP